MVELTSKQKIFKKLLEDLYEKQEAIRKEILYHMAYHEEDGHVVAPKESGFAVCVICGQNLGYYCPESPDHYCHYLYNGDLCDFCNMPRERE